MSQTTDLKEFARRADEAENLLSTLQAQIDYLKTIGDSQAQKRRNNQKQDSSLTKVEDVEDLILKELAEEKSVDSRDFARKYNLTSNDVYGVIQALEAENYVNKKQKTTQPKTTVSNEGIKFIENGSPEVQLFNILMNESSKEISIDSIKRDGLLSDNKMFQIAKNKGCKNKWIKIDKKQNLIIKLVCYYLFYFILFFPEISFSNYWIIF